MAIGKEIFDLQSVIEYEFSDISYLERALTHSSFSYEMRAKGMTILSNERLEFLGDAVLEIVISEHLFNSYKSLDEGVLTKMRQYLVCEKTLAKIAEKINLGAYLNLGKGEEGAGLRRRPKVLADALEALIAAVYLDSRSGKENFAKRLILKLFEEEINNSQNMQKGDYKTMLQQLVEKDGLAVLEYRLVRELGPEHKKLFEIEAYVNNNLVGSGTGYNKKDAEMAAAREALLLFGVKQ